MRTNINISYQRNRIWAERTQAKHQLKTLTVAALAALTVLLRASGASLSFVNRGMLRGNWWTRGARGRTEYASQDFPAVEGAGA